MVGGVLDSADPAQADAEGYLRAIGAADAIGYHPYLYDLSAMQQDTLLLRQWLDANRKANVPLDINGFGSLLDPSGTLPSISAWGREVAKFTQWALCTPSLHVENVQPDWWGGTPGADADVWFGMYSSKLSPTPLGTAYLAAVKQLTTTGCPAPAAPRPPKRSIGSAARTVGSRERSQAARPRFVAQAQAAAQALTAQRRVRLARVRRARTFASTTNSVADSRARSTRWLMPRIGAAWADEPSAAIPSSARVRRRSSRPAPSSPSAVINVPSRSRPVFGSVPLVLVGVEEVDEPLPVDPLVPELPLDPLLPEPLPLDPDDPDDEEAAFATTTTVPFINGCSEQI